MDCVTAQQLVSDAMDKLPVDADALKEAKWHCNECADCGAFVRAMLAVQRAPLPAAPPDLAARIVAQVREEANASAYAKARALATPGHTPPAPFMPELPVAAPAPPANLEGLVSRFRDPRTRRAMIAWTSSAAVLFILAGWGAVFGVRAILAPTTGVVEYEYTGTEGSPAQAPTAGSGRTQDHSVSGPDYSESTTAPQFITVPGDLVYRVGGPATDLDRKTLVEAGETGTDLGPKAGRGGSLLKTEDGTVLVEGEDGNLLMLEPVQFGYDGQVYDLVSKPIESIGEWPTLPAGIDEPRREDGSPTFKEAKEDRPDGVFVLSGQPTSAGIALPPATSLVQPLSACPNWTFWKVHQ